MILLKDARSMVIDSFCRSGDNWHFRGRQSDDIHGLSDGCQATIRSRSYRSTCALSTRNSVTIKETNTNCRPVLLGPVVAGSMVNWVAGSVLGVKTETSVDDSGPGSLLAAGSACTVSASKCSDALNTESHDPQRAQPSEIRSWSGTTRKWVWHAGQRVIRLMKRKL